MVRGEVNANLLLGVWQLGRGGGATRSNYTHSEIDVRRANLNELGSFVLGDCRCITRFRRIDSNESFAMMPHDLPSMYEALPGPSGNPRCYIEGEFARLEGDVQSRRFLAILP